MAQKVVYFVDGAQFGGTEQALLHLLAGLDRERWRPVLFHHHEPGITPLLVGAKDLGVETRIVPRVSGRDVLTDLPRFIYQLRAEQPVVFHAHLNWLLSCKYALLAAAFLRVPAVIATAQQYMAVPWGKTTEWQQRGVSSVVHQYIAVSQAVAAQLGRAFYLPAKKVRVVHNCIPLAPYDCPPDEGLRHTLTGGEQRPLVLTVARLDPQKGLPFLLQAACQVPQAVFALAGSGSQQVALEAQARSLGIEDRVVFLGYRQDVPSLLASSDLFVLPSMYEGLPLSVLEAMAAGKPVISTDVGGTREALSDGETGYLVPPADPPALASAIRRVLSDSALARQMGMAGRARVRRKFSVENMVEGVMNTYEDVLHERGKTSTGIVGR